jgi:hypothetical protein
VPSSPSVAAQPGKAAFGRNDEEEYELRSSREDRGPRVELGADLRGVLRRFVNLEADDRRATAPLEDDDPVRPRRKEAGVTSRRLRKPQLNRRWHLLSPGGANEGTDRFDRIKRMTHVGKAANPRLRVPEPSQSLAS